VITSDQPPAPHVELTTATGLTVRVRQARPQDGPALQAGFEHLSDDSRYTRFFTAVPKLSGSLLRQLTDIDGGHTFAFAVFDPRRPSEVGSEDGYGIGVARWIRTKADPTVAELAIAVIDSYHGHRLGSLLMTGLVVSAHVHGITALSAFVLATNQAMINLLLRLGAERQTAEPGEYAVASYLLGVDTAWAGLAADPATIEAFRSIS